MRFAIRRFPGKKQKMKFISETSITSLINFVNRMI